MMPLAAASSRAVLSLGLALALLAGARAVLLWGSPSLDAQHAAPSILLAALVAGLLFGCALAARLLWKPSGPPRSAPDGTERA